MDIITLAIASRLAGGKGGGDYKNLPILKDYNFLESNFTTCPNAYCTNDGKLSYDNDQDVYGIDLGNTNKKVIVMLNKCNGSLGRIACLPYTPEEVTSHVYTGNWQINLDQHSNSDLESTKIFAFVNRYRYLYVCPTYSGHNVTFECLVAVEK